MDAQHDVLATVLKLDEEGRTFVHNLASTGSYDELFTLLAQLKKCCMLFFSFFSLISIIFLSFFLSLLFQSWH